MAYKILMVEDDSSIAAGLSYALEKEGYLVTLCRKISQAFEEIKTVHFDLALLDMQLPDGLGKEIGQKLLAEQTQVIYLTVVDDEDEIVRTLEDGAADYITKPFRMRELMVRIKRTLNIKTEEQQVMRIGGSGDRCKCRKGVCKRSADFTDSARIPPAAYFCGKSVNSPYTGAAFGADLGYQR